MATGESPSLRRAVVLTTGSSVLVPAAGLVTAPILAQALSTDGRGELAAALAPAALILASATLGLPDALTYLLAKRPGSTRRALLTSSLVTLALGVVCLLVAWLAIPFLSGGSAELGRLIVLATALTVPALLVNVFRGAAVGRQQWMAVAVERLSTSALKVVVFGALFLAGQLTVLAAVLVTCVVALLSGLVYLPLLRRPPADPVEARPDAEPDPLLAGHGTVRPLLRYGSRVWLGSVASMVLSRAAPLLMVPLSSVEDLGLYTVATTVSDVPLVVALAIQGALFGVNAKLRDAGQVTTTARLTLLVAAVGCVVLGATLPLWIAPLFGPEFRPALVPTLMLLASALVCIPGLMAATGLSAWGRPGLRSLGLTVTLVANVGALVLLVPAYGVYGACWTSLVSNVVMATFMILACRRTMGVHARDFVLVRGSDVRRVWDEGMRLVRRVLPGRAGEASAG